MRRLPAFAVPVLRGYTAAVLLIAVVVSPPALVFIPALFFVGYLLFWGRPLMSRTLLLADYFLFFALPVLLSQVIPDYLAWLITLPSVVLILRDIETAGEDAVSVKTSRKRYLTRTGVALPFLAVMALITGVGLNSLTVTLSSAVALICLAALNVITFRGVPAKPVIESAVEERVIAGTKAEVVIELTPQTNIGGNLYLESVYEWVVVHNPALSLREKGLSFQMHLTPPLSGPSTVPVKGYLLDKWGLFQTQFTLEPVRLHVIPRARYAVWLAKRYLSESSTGMLPLISTVGTLHPIFGLRTGIEYYGSQLYQPGDSLKNIDWKHSVKYNKLISKEFADLHGQPAILLINTAVGDAEEADKLVYNAMVAALSLAKEQIPTSIASYDDTAVRLVTPALPPQTLVARCLDITKEVKVIGKPLKYLGQVDVVRLRANIRRLQTIETGPARALTQILQIEYKNLKDVAVQHPVGKALLMAFGKTSDRASVVVVSVFNHDAEALMFNTIVYKNKGNAVLVV
jgi:uncharacterized protein (DUF58 family)